jgi:L-ribulokinase
LAGEEVLVEGVSGVVADGIVPGYFAYETGQASVGDMLAWFVEYSTPPACHREAKDRGISVYALLSEKAAALRPGESGLLALDWWNGCRTPLVDANLSGAIFGYTLRTRPEAIFRALVEATAFGTRQIVELFTTAGVNVERLRAGGGLTQSDLILQIYADVTGLPLEVAALEQASAHGAALLGAVAAGAYDSLQETIEALAPPPSRTFQPLAEHREPYDQLYREYMRLVDLFGRDPQSTLKRLLAIREQWSN